MSYDAFVYCFLKSFFCVLCYVNNHSVLSDEYSYLFRLNLFFMLVSFSDDKGSCSPYPLGVGKYCFNVIARKHIAQVNHTKTSPVR